MTKAVFVRELDFLSYHITINKVSILGCFGISFILIQMYVDLTAYLNSYQKL